MSSIQSINSDFIKRAAELVISNLDEKSFSGNELAALLHLSREQTHRKLKKDTGLSTGKFILYLRLLKAVYYIQNGNATIAEICYKVGFESPAYFNKCFKETWGISPGEARKQMNNLNLAGCPAYKFYQLPEIQDVLDAHDIILSLPEKEKKKSSNNNIWLAGTIAIIVLIIATVFLFYKKKPPVLKLVDNSRIAIIPFINQTGDTTMNQV
ncbi:MAG: AraC family transcriptional regulator, partial [Ginsengibacter sp.]